MSPSTGRTRATDWLLAPGTPVDHYRIVRPLGRGGMAEVYVARDTKLGRKVALKLVRPEAIGQREVVERFLFEAQATARFNHPHIVTIYSVGEADGKPYLALEYLEGQTLRQRMQQERLSAMETVRIGLAIAQALSEAHANGILHRDLKPENVMLVRDGQLRVLDFGLARFFPRGPADPTDLQPTEAPASFERRVPQGVDPFRSTAREIRGSPAYMAPEQWERRDVGGAADMWALGVILYEILAGRRPFDERRMIDLSQAVCGPEAAPPVERHRRVSAALSDLLARCLEKKAAKRPSALEVAHCLQRMLVHDRKWADGEEGPFRGLLPFEEQHQHLFFGRRAEIDAFVERLRTAPLLTLLGPSGAGKSSFVRAGVIPRLRERGPLLVIQLRPGRDPFLNLAKRLVEAQAQAGESPDVDSPVGFIPAVPAEPRAADADRPDADRPAALANELCNSPQLLNLHLLRLSEQRRCHVVLFVDQLEELHALTDEALRCGFMEAVCTAADDPRLPVRVILTLREEFLSRLAEGAGVREALSQIAVLRQPTAVTLREMILRPVETLGYAFDDPALVGEMAAEVQGELSCLSLLQFAGQVLWEGRDRAQRLLNRSLYESMGGVAGVLVQHAEGVLSGLTSEQVNLARAILLRLVTPEGTRQVMCRSRLLEGLDGVADAVLKQLVQARLITGKQSEGEEEVDCELVHESLIHTWGRLGRWIDESREELRTLHQLEIAAQLWDKRGRRDMDVWRGKALAEANQAAAQCEALSTLVNAFLAACNQKRTTSIRRLVSAVAVAMLLIAAAFWVGSTVRTSRLCQGAERKLIGVWDPERKAEIRNALQATGLPYAQTLWTGLEHALDAYSARWVAMHTQACEATRLRGEQSEELLDLRMACLRRRLQALRTLTAILVRADSIVAENAVRAASSLSSLAGCADPQRLAQLTPMPDDPALVRRIEQAQARLASAHALIYAGKFKEAEAHLDSDELEVRRRFPPLEAERSFVQAELFQELGDHPRAQAGYHLAMRAAAASGHDERFVFSMLSLARSLATNARLKQASRWMRLARATFNRIGPDDELEARVECNASFVHRELGSYPDAVKRAQRCVEIRQRQAKAMPLARALQALGAAQAKNGELQAAQRTLVQGLEMIEREVGSEHPAAVDVRSNLAWIGQALGDYPTAVRHARAVVEARKRLLPAHHPDLAISLKNLAVLHMEQGRLEEAERRSLQALEIEKKRFGPRRAQIGKSLGNLAVLSALRGQQDQAFERATESLHILEESLGAKHPTLVNANTLLGIIQRKRARLDDSARWLTRAVNLSEAVLPDDHSDRLNPLIEIAKTELARGRKRRALTLARKAAKLAGKPTAHARLKPDAWFVLADALWQNGVERKRAVALARKARDHWTNLGPGNERELTEVSNWLARHAQAGD